MGRGGYFGQRVPVRAYCWRCEQEVKRDSPNKNGLFPNEPLNSHQVTTVVQLERSEVQQYVAISLAVTM